MSTQKCMTCRWWQVESRKRKEDDGSLLISKGHCCIRAPLLVQWSSEGTTEYSTQWPSTDGGDFCGEWRERDDRAARLLGTKYMAGNGDEAVRQ